MSSAKIPMRINLFNGSLDILHFDRISYDLSEALKSLFASKFPRSRPTTQTSSSITINSLLYSNTPCKSATVTIVMASPTATPIPLLHTDEDDFDATKYCFELFGMAVATIAILVLVIAIAPAIARGFAELFRKFGERRERRRAAEDEETAIELATWNASGVAGWEESGNGKQGNGVGS